MNRREARETVFTLLYERNFQIEEDVQAQYGLALELRELPDDTYMREVYLGVTEHQNELDEKIMVHSGTWSISRMSKITRTILRLSVYEMLYRNDIPFNISINEAVELAKKFGQDESYSFVNGVLARFAA